MNNDDVDYYTADFSVEGMYHAHTLRSPIPRGRVLEIMLPELPEHYCLIGPQDIRGQNTLLSLGVPILAQDEISYLGQPLALLTGPDETVLEELLGQIFVDTEEENPVYDAPDEEGDFYLIRDQGEEDLEEGAQIIAHTYTTGMQEHWYSDSHGALAIPLGGEEEGPLMRIHCASQWPFHVRNAAAQVLGIAAPRVLVVPSRLGLHLDGKLWYPSLIACQAALGAQYLGRPLRLVLSREEDFLYSPKRNPAVINIESSLDEEGKLLHNRCRVELNLGAQAFMGEEILDQTCLALTGGPSSIWAGAYLSNIPPQGPMAGFGLAQGFFASERHASITADTLGQDPAQWRKDRILDQSYGAPFGDPLKNPPLLSLIDQAAAASDYSRKWASYELLRKHLESRDITQEALRGIGIAAAFQGNDFLHPGEGGKSEVELELHVEGLMIKTPLLSPGLREICLHYAQTILGLEESMVRFVHSTDKAPDPGALTLSRGLGTLASLIEESCQNIQEQRFRNPLPITVRKSRGQRPRNYSFQGGKISKEGFSNPGWGAAVAEVEIDPVSWMPRIRGIWMSIEGGRIISPLQAEKTIRLGVIHALGWTCREQVYYQEGEIDRKLYRFYDLNAPSEVPPIHIDFLPSQDDPKGIGELPFSCIPAAYVQALSQAMDHPFTKIPLDARDLLSSWLEKHAGAPG